MDACYQNHATNYLVAKTIVVSIGSQNILFDHDGREVISVSEVTIPDLVLKDGVYQQTPGLKAISIVRSACIDQETRNIIGSLCGIVKEDDLPIKLRLHTIVAPVMTDGGLMDFRVLQTQVTVLDGTVRGEQVWVRDVELGFVRQYAGI